MKKKSQTQFSILFQEKTGLYSVEIKGIQYTLSRMELESLMFLIVEKMLLDTRAYTKKEKK